MSPILGIWASSQYVSKGSYESISTVTVGGGGSASISFTSIPSTYTHLQIRCFARTTRADSDDQLRLQLNSDTATNYSQHALSGNGTGVSASGTANTTFMFLGRSAAATSGTSIFGAAVIELLDYANTNKYKTLRGLTGLDMNGSGFSTLTSGSWRNTAAVTSIQITFIGALMGQYSSFALYGIKGA